jgi:hypothetical protein
LDSDGRNCIALICFWTLLIGASSLVLSRRSDIPVWFSGELGENPSNSPKRKNRIHGSKVEIVTGVLSAIIVLPQVDHPLPFPGCINYYSEEIRLRIQKLAFTSM